MARHARGDLETWRKAIQRRLAASVDLWRSASDYAQESMARTLSPHLEIWRELGWTPVSLFALVEEVRPDLGMTEFGEMLQFVFDWEGAA